MQPSEESLGTVFAAPSGSGGGVGSGFGSGFGADFGADFGAALPAAAYKQSKTRWLEHCATWRRLPHIHSEAIAKYGFLSFSK